jgi:hypothetical protein
MMVRLAEQAACMVKRITLYRGFAEKLEGSTQLERPISRWYNNIKMYLKANKMGVRSRLNWLEKRNSSGPL